MAAMVLDSVPPSSSDWSAERLKALKNSLIGNPIAKNALAEDQATISQIISYINSYIDDQYSILESTLIEAAYVLSSLSYGSPDAIRSLLRCYTADVLLRAIATDRRNEGSPGSPSTSLSSREVRSSLVRAFKSVVNAIADVSHPREWGLGPPLELGETMLLSIAVLQRIFRPESLDVFLPLLADPSQQIRIFISQLLASSLRDLRNRKFVSAWLPPAERATETKGKRGWEKPEMSHMGGGWTTRHLTELVRSGDLKMKEAALGAIAAISKGNQAVATALCLPVLDVNKSPSQGRLTPFSLFMDLCKSRNINVRLAACLCVTNIIRAASPGPPAPKWIADPPYTLMGVLNGIIDSSSASAQSRSKACFILYQLVMDDKDLERAAFVSGSLKALAHLMDRATPLPDGPWPEDEAESTSVLIEAALTAIASLTLHRDDNRLSLLETPIVIPVISRCLVHPHYGVRYGACQCVRALSRSVNVLRTNIGDSKLAELLFEIVKNDTDDRVMLVALMGIANMVNDFAPTRETLIKSGVIRRLSEIIKTGNEEMKTNSIWALRNALYHSSRSDMESIMAELGWAEFESLLKHPKPRIREISSAAVTNMMARSSDVEFVLQSLPNVLYLLEDLIRPTLDEATTVNALKAISNFSTVPEHRALVLARPGLLRSIRDCLLHPSSGVRKAAIVCVITLVEHQQSHEEIREAEIDAALRGLALSKSSGSAILGSPGLGNGGNPLLGPIGSSGLPSDDKEMRENARAALKWITQGRS